jgi:hypothetical protein
MGGVANPTLNALPELLGGNLARRERGLHPPQPPPHPRRILAGQQPVVGKDPKAQKPGAVRDAGNRGFLGVQPQPQARQELPAPLAHLGQPSLLVPFPVG